ncbi:MAG TPA: type II toxin-antitoxin system RelE/ParE family toxin [Candidatus Magasanikbacteria bacterium]|nr:type II toxin-antitoxin system RelE/ParE family toxin [Candidatus Magasanikbacteria bacterium]
MEEYKVFYYKNSSNGKQPAREFIFSLDKKVRAKVFKYLEYLRLNNGYLDEPYSRHIKNKIRELRVDFAKEHHRIFYFTFINKKIILLNGFTKRTTKTPENEIEKAIQYYFDIINNTNLYEE